MQVEQARQILDELNFDHLAGSTMGSAWELEIDLGDKKTNEPHAKAIDLTFTFHKKLVAHFKSRMNCPSSFCLIKSVQIMDATPEGLRSYLESLHD